MKKTDPEELLTLGLHFGHKRQRIHPNSKKYIHKMEKGVAIIDLFQTAEKLDQAKDFVLKLGEQGKSLLVVASKRQVRDFAAEICQKNNLFYITSKWVGGFLTNFAEISKNIEKMKEMEKEKEKGGWDKLPKHEQVGLKKELLKISRIYEGVRDLDRLPDALFIVDIRRETVVVEEAQKKDIPTVAVVDTNCDPELIDYPIPSNDDGILGLKYLVEQIVQAYVEGRKKKK